jgi:hypothetical protein
MRYTLIQLVQRVLESIDSDEVNTIGETPESLSVANIIKENYNDIIGEIEPHEVHTLFHLDASTDDTKPCLMYLPENISRIELLQYNVGTITDDVQLRTLEYMPLPEFMRMVGGLDSEADWVAHQTINWGEGDFTFKLRNDIWPTWWTSPDDKTILFDAYKSTEEDTLTSIRTYGEGFRIPSFQMVDTYTPELDARSFQLLLQKSKAQASIELKQVENTDAKAKARRNQLLAYKTKDSTDPRSAIRKHGGYGRARPQRRILGRD